MPICRFIVFLALVEGGLSKLSPLLLNENMSQNPRFLVLPTCTSVKCHFQATAVLAILLFLQGFIVKCTILWLDSKLNRPCMYSFLNIFTAGACLATAVLELVPNIGGYLSQKPAHYILSVSIILVMFGLLLYLNRVPLTQFDIKPNQLLFSSYEKLYTSNIDDDNIKLTVGNLKMEYSRIGESVHNILQYVALGLSTSWSTRLTLFIIMSSHRAAESLTNRPSFARGQAISALQSALTVATAIVAWVWGVQILVRRIVFSLVSGSFLYFGAFEILTSELIEKTEMPSTKFSCFVLGNALVVAILAFVKIIS